MSAYTGRNQMFRRLSFTGVAAFGLTFAAGAIAGENSGAYVGASGGKSILTLDGTDFKESATAYKVFGGYTFGDFLAVEGAYINGGKASKDYFGISTVEVSASGFNASLLLRARTGGSFALFGKIGYALYKWDAVGSMGATPIPTPSDSTHSYSYGGGLTYTFSRKYIVRLEYEGLNIRDGKFNAVTAGAGIKF
jgi:opacity protein-like surface antigen